MSAEERDEDGQASHADLDDGNLPEDDEDEQDDGNYQADAQLLALRQECEQLEAKIQEEKALSEKAEAARLVAQEQKTTAEAQIAEKRKELAELEKESNELMVEGRMYQLASREYDLPLKDTWTDKPEQALVVDLSRMMRTLEQAVRGLSVRGTSSGQEVIKTGEVEVVRVKADGTEVSKTLIPVKTTSTVGEVLKSACSYWSLDPKECEVENAQGRKLVRRDAVPPDTTQLVLKERSTEAAVEYEEDNDGDLQEGDKESVTGSEGREHRFMGSGPIGPGIEGNGSSPDVEEMVQVGHASITRRDSRVCHHLELLVIVLLATTFVAMSIEFRRVSESFSARETVKRLFADQLVVIFSTPSSSSTQPSFIFEEANSRDKMWTWLTQSAAIYSVEPSLTANCPTNPNSSFQYTQMTISQLRVNANANCASVNVGGIARPCYATFSSPQQIVPFADIVTDPLVQNAFLYNATAQARSVSGCSTWPSLVSDTFTGLYEYYPARQLDMYALDLDPSFAVSQITALQQNGWVDSSTRVVTATFTAFQQGSGVSITTIAMFEFLPNESVFPKWISIPFMIQVNDESFDLAFIIVTLILVGVSFGVNGFKGFRYPGRLLLDALILIFVVLYYIGNLQLDSWYETCADDLSNAPSGELFMDFRGASFQSQLVGNLIGVVVVLLAVKLGLQLDSSPSTSRIVRALHRAFPQYLSLGFIVVVVTSCFALMAHFIFGRSASDFYVIDLAFASLWISFSAWNSGAYVGIASWGAVVLSVAAYITIFLVLLFLCFAVTAASYFAVSDEIRSKGYHWLSESRASARYADQVVAPSGTIKGANAQNRLIHHRSTNRTYGQN